MNKILIVEDDVNLLKLYSDLFEKENFVVGVAEDGDEALQKASDFSPDVVLLDLMLPNVDGFKVLEGLKEDPVTKKIKVVVHTNLDSDTQKEKALKLGAEKFLAKTGDDPGYLVAAIKQVIS